MPTKSAGSLFRRNSWMLLCNGFDRAVVTESLKYLFLIAILCRYTLFAALPEGFANFKLFIDVLQSVSIALGAMIVLLNFSTIQKKKWFEIVPYILFTIFYSITLFEALTFSVVAIGGLLSYIVYIFALSQGESKISPALIVTRIFQLNTFLITATFLFSSATIGLFFSGRSFVVTDILALGIVDGRFYGATGSPNKDAILAAVSIILMIINYSIVRRGSFALKSYYLLNFLIQITVLALGSSRGGILFLLLFPLMTSILLVLRQWGNFGLTLRIFKPFFIALLVIVVAKGTIDFIGQGLRSTERAVASVMAKPVDEALGRVDSGDISSGRFQLWTTCAKLVLQNPFGVGFPNIDTECIRANPGKHLSGISAGMHNVFLQALVGAGIFGLLATIFIFVHLVYKLWWIFRRSLSLNYESSILLYHSLALISCLLCYALYENGPLFSHNIPSLLFWIYLGYVTSIDMTSKSIVDQE